MIGGVDANQTEYPFSGLPSGFIGDVYVVPVVSGTTYHFELAVEGSGGGTVDEANITLLASNSTSTILTDQSQQNSSVQFSDQANGSQPVYTNTFTPTNSDLITLFIDMPTGSTGVYSLSMSTDTATLGQEMLTGTANDDLFFGLRGKDTIDGGAGNDGSIYIDDSTVFTMLFNTSADPISIVDRSGNSGTDVLRNIELIQFDYKAFPVSSFDNVTNLNKAQFSSFTEMYIAYFNRAPDSEGLMFWANTFSNGLTLGELAEFFAQSTEAQAAFPATAPNSGFVTAVYDNVLGRQADATGEAFWIGVLDSGAVTRSQFVLEILQGARAAAPAGADAAFIAQQAADVAFLNDKIDIGLYFSAWLGMSDPADAFDVMDRYDGSATSKLEAKTAADDDFVTAVAADGSGEFLIQLRGVFDDPFAIA